MKARNVASEARNVASEARNVASEARNVASLVVTINNRRFSPSFRWAGRQLLSVAGSQRLGTQHQMLAM